MSSLKVSVLAVVTAFLMAAPARADVIEFDLTFDSAFFGELSAYDDLWIGNSWHGRRLTDEEATDFLLGHPEFQRDVRTSAYGLEGFRGLLPGETARGRLHYSRDRPARCDTEFDDGCHHEFFVQDYTINGFQVDYAFGLSLRQTGTSTTVNVYDGYSTPYASHMFQIEDERGTLFYDNDRTGRSDYSAGNIGVSFSWVGTQQHVSNFRILPSPVPLPTTGWMLLAALGAAGFAVKRRKDPAARAN